MARCHKKSFWAPSYRFLIWFTLIYCTEPVLSNFRCLALNTVTVRKAQLFHFRSELNPFSNCVYLFMQIVVNNPVRIWAEFFSITINTNIYYQSILKHKKLPRNLHLFPWKNQQAWLLKLTNYSIEVLKSDKFCPYCRY